MNSQDEESYVEEQFIFCFEIFDLSVMWHDLTAYRQQ